MKWRLRAPISRTHGSATVSPPRWVAAACPPDVANKVRRYEFTSPTGVSAPTLEAVASLHRAFEARAGLGAPAPAPLPAIITTDGVHIDRPVKPEERAALLAYLRKL